MTKKFIFIVGLVEWGSYHGCLMPYSLKIFKTKIKALNYIGSNKNLTIFRRILN